MYNKRAFQITNVLPGLKFDDPIVLSLLATPSSPGLPVLFPDGPHHGRRPPRRSSARRRRVGASDLFPLPPPSSPPTMTATLTGEDDGTISAGRDRILRRGRPPPRDARSDQLIAVLLLR